MHYFFPLVLAIILSAAFIYPAGAQSHKPKINKDVVKEIRKARLIGRYGDLTGKPAACDCSDRDSGQITRIVIHSTHHTRSIGDAVNQSSIGTELYSTTAQERSRQPFTNRQKEALIRLTARLMNTYHIPVDQVSRHADYSPLVDCLTIPESYKGNTQEYVRKYVG